MRLSLHVFFPASSLLLLTLQCLHVQCQGVSLPDPEGTTILQNVTACQTTQKHLMNSDLQQLDSEQLKFHSPTFTCTFPISQLLYVTGNVTQLERTSSMKSTPGTISALPSSLHSATFAFICSRTSALISPVSPTDKQHLTSVYMHNNLHLRDTRAL